MMPEDRKGPQLSDVKRSSAALKRAIAHQEKILLAVVEYNGLVTKLQDLRDFNAGRINGKPEDFSPKLQTAKAAAEKREYDRRGY